MQYFVLLTLSYPARDGLGQITMCQTVTTLSALSRADLYQYMRQQAAAKYGSDAERANVVFYSAEPNNIG